MNKFNIHNYSVNVKKKNRITKFYLDYLLNGSVPAIKVNFYAKIVIFEKLIF